MSNQVFSGPVSRYYSQAAESDELTLAKTIGANPVIGQFTGPLDTAGDPIIWNRLNGNDCTFAAGKYNYQDFQSIYTKPYYTLTSTVLAFSKCTLLTALVDNVISVDVVAPIIVGVLSTSYTINVAVVLMNGIQDSDYSAGKVVMMSQRVVNTAASTQPSIIAFSGDISMRAGQVLGVFVSKNPVAAANTYTIMDDANGKTTIMFEASCRFSKV